MRSSLAIGDFSRATHLNIKTLRHYHEVGLLEPSDVDPRSGYRYYSYEQIPAAQHLSVRQVDRDLGPRRENRALAALLPPLERQQQPIARRDVLREAAEPFADLEHQKRK